MFGQKSMYSKSCPHFLGKFKHNLVNKPQITNSKYTLLLHLLEKKKLKKTNRVEWI